MYIARQPIFDKTMKVYGYELLFRSGEESVSYGGSTAENSTATVLGGLFELGLEKIVGSRRAFINFDYNFLLSDTIELIDPEILVIEVLENTKADKTLMDRIKELKKKGYRVALDDFTENLEVFPLVPLADILKYDIIQTPLNTIKRDVKLALSEKKIILAEKIETEEEFEQAKSMGFQLFQGYFFSRPKIVGGVKKRLTTNTIYNRIMTEIHKEEPSFTKLSNIIETDVDMAYKVLKLINQKKDESDYSSIKRALTRIGLIEMERWVHVLMLQEISSKKPSELIRLSLVRSKFGELIAESSTFRNRKDEVSLMFLFSVLDTMMDQTMAEALEGVSVSDDIKEVLINKNGPLKPICQIVHYYEMADWEKMNEAAQIIGLEKRKIFMCYLEAIKWASETMKTIWEN